VRAWGCGGLVFVLGLSLTAWLLNVSKAGSRVLGCLEGCTSVGARRDGPLRVMSLNVLHGFPKFSHTARRLTLIADEVRRRDPDLVCLQEVPWTRDLDGASRLAELTGLNYAFLRANGNRRTIGFEEGVAILSRFPLKEISFVELRPRAGLFEHRVALHALAVTPWGGVDVFVTHLTHGRSELNRRQGASLQAFVAATGSKPAIVAGDFNALEDESQISALVAQGWVDAYRTVHPQEFGATCCVGNLSGGPDQSLGERIDYLFLVPQGGEEMAVLDVQRVFDRPFRVPDGWLWASDHAGLWAEVELGQ
jgi:endonuclease/exonuclease/phosphatase family metal-dependent hydrolase